MILTDHKVGVGFNKENMELPQAVMDGLAAIRENGSERAIYDKYHIDYQLAQPFELLTE
jgi:polar amino acid transport system substrate-binding protein